ncbi:LPS-assembly protein LptD [Campylobacter sp. CCS1377]|uniref:LPS-assembly protein LptD n=1 Tax=Campylobacter sp. CCS1377 TaxID=3158229 RepID=A0AAU7EAH2_9BACT
MLRKLALSVIACASIYAAEVDIYALDVKKEGAILKAESEVLVFSDLYMITANKAIYNEETKVIELFGDVNILRGKNERSHSEYAKIKLDSNEASFEEFFFANSDVEVWFKSKNSYLDNHYFDGKNSVVSSCNVEDPDWKIKFSEGRLNRENNFVHLYNARLYIKNIPVFYLPYLGFSIDTNRRSGLLVPRMSVNSSEGLFYEQPIYFVFDSNWDLEFTPQVRTNRGFGAYTTLRFLDSPHSMGEINFGAFRENSSYFRDENLENQTHMGIELKYSRNDLVRSLLSDEFQEGLWIDAIYLNDVDYLNLGRRDFRDMTSLVTSKINYYLADDSNYYGMYAKYYIDTSKTSNSDTLQEFPSFQYHRFLDTLFSEHLQYSFDASFHNYYRKIGTYSTQLNLELPLSYHTSFFDDYLQLTFTEYLYASFVNYSNNPEIDNEHLYRNSHELTLYTELSKPYENFYHTVFLELNYYLPGSTSGKITENYLDYEDKEEQTSFRIVQYFYNAQGQKKLKHRLGLNYYNDRDRLGSVDNILTYYFNENISLNNESRYSQIQGRFDKVLSQLEFSTQNLNWTFSHAYRNDIDGKYSFIGTRADYIYNYNYKIFSGIWFDTQRAHPNMWEVGYTYQRKCWNYSLMYRERIDPQLTSGGIKAKTQSGFYFVFNFYPLGGVKYDLSLDEAENKLANP